MQNITKLSEGLFSTNGERVNVLCKNTYTSAPRTHKEPTNISWQWSVRKEPDLTKCTDLCVPKVCPKKRFLPRLKKSFIPTEKKACDLPKRKESWANYFSFLLPDPVPKPPIITCRKLQARRRECCGNPMDCGAYCLRDNCCPPAKEWYGQAVIYDIPSSFPEPAMVDEPKPCSPPPPAEPPSNLALKGMCPPPKKELNMDDYAYKRPFSGINVCLESKSQPQIFKCQHSCNNNEQHEVDIKGKLTCGFSFGKSGECPRLLKQKDVKKDLPPLVCQTSKESTPETKEILVEEKKGVCGRISFLKPYKTGEKYPGMEKCRSYHTLSNSLSDSLTFSKRLYSSATNNQITIAEPSPSALAQSNWLAYESPAFVTRPSYYQPSHSGLPLQAVLTRHMAGLWKEDGMYVPPEHRSYRYSVSSEMPEGSDLPDINPELLALAEETRKKVKKIDYGEKETQNEPPVTLVRRLSNEVTQRLVKRAKEGLEENSPTRHVPLPVGRTKLSLLKKERSPLDYSRATFATHTSLRAKIPTKDTSKNKTICSGCSGIRQAEEESKNPSPKSFLDCKVRAAGKCRGPTRTLLPGEPEPSNPYYKNKAKPFSICNQPRPIVKKEERPYKMPCEEKKRKFHTSSLFSASTPAFTSLYDIVKSKGISLNDKGPNSRLNAWDSHTPDSYQEKEVNGYDSVPDLENQNSVDVRKIPTQDAYPSISVRSNKFGLSQISSPSLLTANIPHSERTLKKRNEKFNDWGSPTDYDKFQTEDTVDISKTQAEETKKSDIKMETSAVNIWDVGKDTKAPFTVNPRVDENKSNVNDHRSVNKNDAIIKGTQISGLKASNSWPSNNLDKAININTRSERKQTRFSAIFSANSREKQKIKDIE